MNDDNIIARTYLIADGEKELKRAEALYPDWPTNMVIAWATVAEESGEVTKAVNNHYHGHKGGTIGDIRKEIIQLQAMLFRFVENMNEYK